MVAGAEGFVVTHKTEADRSNAHYLITKGTTRDQFEAYAKASQSGDAKKAFEALAGKPMAQFEPEWRAYLAALK